MRIAKNKILVEVWETKTMSEGGIALPDDSVQKLPVGKVVQGGIEISDTLCVGDVILFSGVAAIALEPICSDKVLIEEEDVLAVLSEEEYRAWKP